MEEGTWMFDNIGLTLKEWYLEFDPATKELL